MVIISWKCTLFTMGNVVNFAAPRAKKMEYINEARMENLVKGKRKASLNKGICLNRISSQEKGGVFITSIVREKRKSIKKAIKISFLFLTVAAIPAKIIPKRK